MNLETFVKINNLEEIEFESIEYKDSSIYIKLIFNVEIEYMANGCRPEFDYSVKHLYIFKNQDKCKNIYNMQYVLDYKYENDCLYLKLSECELTIKNCEIEVISNL